MGERLKEKINLARQVNGHSILAAKRRYCSELRNLYRFPLLRFSAGEMQLEAELCAFIRSRARKAAELHAGEI